MTKIAFIGAGSLGFTRELVRDILTFPLLEDATLALMDIDPERLDFAKQAVEKIVRLGNYPAKVVATLDRVEALRDADVVLTTILAGGTDVWRHDIEIPKKYGVDINVGDTRGPSGIFRFLRTIPDDGHRARHGTLLPQGHPAELHQPDGDAVPRDAAQTFIPTTGLCHCVQGTAEMLAEWIGAPLDEITYTCAGINHQAWYLEFKWNGAGCLSADPQGRHRRAGSLQSEIVRNEMYLHLGYYVTESSGHNSEYNWWFRKRPDLIEKYCTHGTGWNPGEYAYILKEYQNNEATWKEQAQEWFAAETPIALERGHEYAAYIINALQGGELFKFNGNVPNTQLDHQPAAGRLRRSAGAGRQGRLPSDSRRRAAAAVRAADQSQQQHRRNGGHRFADRRPDDGLSRHRARSADGGRAVAGGDQADGERDVQAESSVPAAVQAG